MKNTFDVVKIVKMWLQLRLVGGHEDALAALEDFNLDNVFVFAVVDFTSFPVNFSLNKKGNLVIDDIFQGINLILEFEVTLSGIGEPAGYALLLLDLFNLNWFWIWNEKKKTISVLNEMSNKTRLMLKVNTLLRQMDFTEMVFIF